LDIFGSLLVCAENQFGFKKGLGCSNAIYSVHQVVDSYVSKGTIVNICSIDLSKAFYKVNHYYYMHLPGKVVPEITNRPTVSD